MCLHNEIYGWDNHDENTKGKITTNSSWQPEKLCFHSVFMTFLYMSCHMSYMS